VLVPAVTATHPAHAQVFKTLYSFCTQTDCADGKYPDGGLIQATDGNFYGITDEGGANGVGTVFRITRSGKLTTLYNFCSRNNCTDGEQPLASLIQATDGNFYGTTEKGGANADGTVFKITPSGTLTTLYNFCSETNCRDGKYPIAGLIQATDGNFYGTTYEGGGGTGGSNGNGTFFKITPSGTLTTLHRFCSKGSCVDGASPVAGVIQARNGDFYGTAEYGGSNNILGGVIFKITPSGTLTTLYSFCAQSDCTDGEAPSAALVQATDGSFYGTTFLGGSNGDGTVFKITPSGTLTTLHSFCSQMNSSGNCLDGTLPEAGLIQASNGQLYGTTFKGGTKTEICLLSEMHIGCGTVFKITPGGTLITLHDFGMGSKGPVGLTQGTDGDIYGIAYEGGTEKGGTVFSLSEGIGPFVETQTTSGEVGAVVNILGSDLAGATSVTFNATAATFTIVSNSYIKTTVPTGATTGYVEVTTPGGTLTSNVVYAVKP
jgi:uncharacterized repeat protein (TIGR03803 family)